MEIRLNKFVVLLSMILSFISYKIHAQDKSANRQEIEKTIVITDFLNKKYFDGYRMSVDESTPADHPLFSYLDCKKEGYFSVHFIPRGKLLSTFWKDKYFEEIKFEYDDVESANDYISKLLIGKSDLYDIYAYHVEKQYLESSNGCTIESVYLNNKSFAKIYFYNQKSKKWIFKKSIKSEMLPPQPDANFFKSNFTEETVGKSR